MVVVYWDFIPLKSGSDISAEQDTATVTKELEEPAAKRKMTLFWKEENWTRLKKAMGRHRNTVLNGVCEADCLELDEDTVTQQTVNICLQTIVNKLVTYENYFPPR